MAVVTLAVTWFVDAPTIAGHVADVIVMATPALLLLIVVVRDREETRARIGEMFDCGTDFLVEHELQWFRDRNIELATKLSTVSQEVKRSASPQWELVKLRDKLRAAIHPVNEAAMNSVSRLDQDDEAQGVVRGHAYPDVYVEICHCLYVVTRTASAVRFRLDKSTANVLMEPIGKDVPHEKNSHRR